MKTIYIAHSVTNGNQSFGELNTLISWLKQKKYKVSQPDYLLFPDLIASEALKSIEQSDIVIADVTLYSHGVGFELGYAYALKKHIIVISNLAAKYKLSRFLLGLFPNIIFYQNRTELVTEISNKLMQCSRFEH